MITIFGQTLEVHKIILITNFAEVTGANLRPRKGVSYDFTPRIKEL